MAHFDQQFVFVGLGNPGSLYELTRHNLGYLVVKALARRMGWHFKEEKRFNAFVAKGLVGNHVLHLLLPTTYMNLSGVSVRQYLDFFKLSIKNLVIVTDDIALPFGQLRLKTMGSAGGHNGLKSIESHLGTTEYIRLRMGIGHPGEKFLADYVLDPFTKEELEHLVMFIDRGADVLEDLVKKEISKVMNTVNTLPSCKKAPLTENKGKEQT